MKVVKSEVNKFVISSNGNLYAKGGNYFGQLGLGDNKDRDTFTKVDVDNVKDVICTANHTLILKTNGELYGCGNNSSGQLGLGDNKDRHIPTKIDIYSVKEVKCGSNHTYAIKNDGSVYSTGSNRYGQLDVGDNMDRDLFTKTSITYIKDEIYEYYNRELRKHCTGDDKQIKNSISDIISKLYNRL